MEQGMVRRPTACERMGLNIKDPAQRAAFEKMAVADALIASRSGRRITPEAIEQYRQVTKTFIEELGRTAKPKTQSVMKS